MNDKIKSLLEVWSRKPQVKIAADPNNPREGEITWGDFFLDDGNQAWAAELVGAMAAAVPDIKQAAWKEEIVTIHEAQAPAAADSNRSNASLQELNREIQLSTRNQAPIPSTAGIVAESGPTKGTDSKPSSEPAKPKAARAGKTPKPKRVYKSPAASSPGLTSTPPPVAVPPTGDTATA